MSGSRLAAGQELGLVPVLARLTASSADEALLYSNWRGSLGTSGCSLDGVSIRSAAAWGASTPRSDRASTMALMTAGVAPMVPARRCP